MMKRNSWLGAVVALGAVSAVALSANVALASSHREAPAIANDPAADNTDTYAFVQDGNLVVVANYIGLELPEGGPNWAAFSDDVLYQIHIAHGGDSLADALTYNFQFTTAKPADADENASPPLHLPNTGGLEFFAQLTGSGAFGQTYSVTQLTNGANPTPYATNISVPPPNVGPTTNAVVFGLKGGDTYESFFIDSGKDIGATSDGGKVFAGPRDDPFFVDLGAIFDLAQLRPVANPTSTNKFRDSIAYMNVHAIVLAIPLKTANLGTAPSGKDPKTDASETVGVWASASRRKVSILRRTGSDAHFGPYVQVSRLGLPLINEAVIGLEDKDFWNRVTPADDLADFAGYFQNPIAVRDAEAVGFYGSGGPLAACTKNGGADLETGRAADILPVINAGFKINASGDVLRVNLNTASGASAFPNGRALTDTIVDEELGLLLCKNPAAILGAAGPQTNEPEAPLPKGGKAAAKFPYLQTPWEGRTASPRVANNP